jgi:hypothetical protein
VVPVTPPALVLSIHVVTEVQLAVKEPLVLTPKLIVVANAADCPPSTAEPNTASKLASSFVLMAISVR